MTQIPRLSQAEKDRLEEAVLKDSSVTRATLGSTVFVEESFSGEEVWSGWVCTFVIDGNPLCSICYAWSEHYEDTGKDRIFTVMQLGPVQSPADAVRASILADYKSEE
ncbi:MAG: hypothetical protein IH855_13440 [Bacteroidetes bacterium]|nr:hypothetical protein [Bacteroidota bacterium]